MLVTNSAVRKPLQGPNVLGAEAVGFVDQAHRAHMWQVQDGTNLSRRQALCPRRILPASGLGDVAGEQLLDPGHNKCLLSLSPGNQGTQPGQGSPGLRIRQETGVFEGQPAVETVWQRVTGWGRGFTVRAEDREPTADIRMRTRRPRGIRVVPGVPGIRSSRSSRLSRGTGARWPGLRKAVHSSRLSPATDISSPKMGDFGAAGYGTFAIKYSFFLVSEGPESSSVFGRD